MKEKSYIAISRDGKKAHKLVGCISKTSAEKKLLNRLGALKYLTEDCQLFTLSQLTQVLNLADDKSELFSIDLN